MTTFFEEQTARDLTIATVIADGHFTAKGLQDECRRWSLCGDCDTESPELRWLHEQIAWEDDHTVWYCERRFDETESLDPEDPELFPLPHIPAYARRLEPLPEREHVTVRTDPSYLPSRRPQAMPQRKAA
ncbi:hypothetical protein ABZ215_33550 [Amycolatopsis sp. NPDC006131]|uniref:hypothetical protein n=1 Tax=Amycolatopsis sp. NPDC006131 TaxID=3156731 RepID=UPI0033A94ABE